MYNPDRKRAFITSESGKSGFSEEFAEKLFETLEQFELREGKDVCEMTGPCLLRTVFDVLSRIQTTYRKSACRNIEEAAYNGIRRQYQVRKIPSREDLLSILRCYGRWCAANIYPWASIELTEIEDPAKVRYRYRFVANPAHLKMYLDDLYPLDDTCPTLNDIYQSFFWLAFSGVMEEDAVELTPENLDFRKMEIRFGGSVYPIYAEAVQPLMNAAESTQLRINHPKYKKVSMRARANGDLILRGFQDFSLMEFRNAMMKPMSKRYDTDFLSPYLNYQNVRYSGVFYRCFLLEMAGVRLDFDEVTRNSYTRRSGKSETMTQSNFVAKKKSVLTGYAQWKDVFAPK